MGFSFVEAIDCIKRVSDPEACLHAAIASAVLRQPAIYPAPGGASIARARDSGM
jgi:hypothetical protein